MLALAELGGLGTGQDQRIARGQVRPRARPDERLLVNRDRRIAVSPERLRVELDLARGRGEPGGHPVAPLRVLAVLRRERYAYAARLRPQRFQREPGRGELVTVGGVDVAVPEMA